MELKTEFLEYYKENLNLTDSDFEAFTSALHDPLPMTFRILDATLCQHIESFNLATKVVPFSDVYECDKEVYKTSKLRETVIKFTNISKVYRQEIASMLPVHFLKVKQEDFVLDMCAAPGSKALQILERLKDGLLVANDANAKRCDILGSNIKQMNNPNVIITNHDSRRFPTVYRKDNTKLRFDKILCDVPCSGDGTIRKNKDIKWKWNKSNGVGLMKTQFDILRRGLNLLKENGTLVYSTCSFNPLENEAIIQRAVKECGCEIISLDPPSGFKFRQGLTTWNPMIKATDNNAWYFPNGEDIGLSKCMRILPQDQNTGGFFIAVLRKNDVKTNPIVHRTEVFENTDPKILYKSIKGDLVFYNVEPLIKHTIEQQFKIEINEIAISKSLNNNQVSFASKAVYEMLESNQQMVIVSAGYHAFSKIGFKHEEENLFRPKPNVLEQFRINNDSVVHVNIDDALKLLDCEFVDNEYLSFKTSGRGCFVLKFREMDGYYCLWCGPNKTGLMINRNYRLAIKDIVMFRKEQFMQK